MKRLTLDQLNDLVLKAGDAGDARALACAKAGDKKALSYLRSVFTPRPPQEMSPAEEDGPCSGFGVEACIIY